jgi:hypothetical protein
MKPTNLIKPLLACLLGALVVSHTFADDAQREATKLRMTEGKALFEEKCRTVAGEKIYKAVPDVEGLLLLKVRPKHGEREQSDWMWPGAAFAIEAYGDSYITSFLGYEYGREVRQNKDGETITVRGYINTDKRPDGIPGYRWVEVVDEKGSKRYRYLGRWEEPWQKDKSYLKGYIKYYLDKVSAPGASPRYGVTYEDHVIPEERRLGLASSTVKVLDLQTGEVLGEMLRYAWSPGAPSPANPTPWLTAYKCPGHSVGASSATRKFVDQILLPKKGQ